MDGVNNLEVLKRHQKKKGNLRNSLGNDELASVDVIPFLGDQGT